MSDTLAAPAAHTLEVKHSRFQARAQPVASSDAAMAWLAEAAVADATHNCWAWRIGDGYRFNDDGEPAGTAGRPILAAIDAQDCDHVVVLVTRWYGGIKLGAGGLARAYGGAAAQCLRDAQRQPLIAMRGLRVQAGFDDLGVVHAALAIFDAEKLDETYPGDGVRLHLRLPADRAGVFASHLRDATRGRARIVFDNADPALHD